LKIRSFGRLLGKKRGEGIDARGKKELCRNEEPGMESSEFLITTVHCFHLLTGGKAIAKGLILKRRGKKRKRLG